MFERRLKIFLGILIGITVILLVRAAHLQLANGDYWRKQAAEAVRRRTLVEPVRGTIVDFNGNVLARDDACIDVAVDYRAIDLDEKWLKEQATSRLIAHFGPNYRRAEKTVREKMLKDETEHVKADIANLWKTLAQISGKSLEEIEELKLTIRRRVEMRRRYVWYKKYEQAVKSEGKQNSIPWYKDWRLAGKSNPDLDNFNVEVSEQTEAHVIVPNISTETHNQLKKHLEQFPGLVIRPSKHRVYPYGEVACHIIGHLTSIEEPDLKNDPNDGNELLEYYPNDKIGRSGIESLCELTLRGQRGRIERLLGHDEIYAQQEALGGKTVRLTIDIKLQNDIENAFKRVVWRDPVTDVILEDHEMHGAAVVIDIPTGQVRALVSYPTYDLNTLDEMYSKLATDYINQPLVNRATQSQLEPGSTVKPIVGIGAVSQKVMSVSDTIECDGYLTIDGRRQLHGRCWTASNFAKSKPQFVAHHQIPSYDPHPDGHLNLIDAIQRSCNVYFENMGDRLGLDGLSYWYSQFGLGRPTGIGIPEAKGRLPGSFAGPVRTERSISWYASIGQGQVWATPIQMANVAATIGRSGLWVRPRLVTDVSDIAKPTTRPFTESAMPERVALPVSPEAVAAVQEGMYRVVNTLAGSANAVARKDFVICGKTGTAQAHVFSIYIRDENGNKIKGKDDKYERYFPPMSTRAEPNEKMPWYRGDGENANPHHAWFIGFAPRENPKVAFAIMLEYGGTGGHDAAPVSKAVLDACIKYKYLP
jgi:penicillin-binding protein 2